MHALGHMPYVPLALAVAAASRHMGHQLRLMLYRVSDRESHSARLSSADSCDGAPGAVVPWHGQRP